MQFKIQKFLIYSIDRGAKIEKFLKTDSLGVF